LMADSFWGAVPRGVAGLPLRTRSTVGPWTLVMSILVVAATVDAFFAGTSSVLAYWGIVAIIGFGLGVLIGSPMMRPWERGILGFVIGSIGAVSGSLISVLIALSLETERVEVIPVLVAFVSGVAGIVAGAACALGILVGGFLRGRLPNQVAIA
jgi:hypothetical protein